MENTDVHPGPGSDPAAGRPVPQLPPVAPARRPGLRRSRTDRMLSGVCGGIAEAYDVDAALLRVGVVALTLVTGGAAAVVYVAAWLVTPEGDRPAM